MNEQAKQRPHGMMVGIESGATRTVAAAMAWPAGNTPGKEILEARMELGPGNLRMMSDAQLAGHLRHVARAMPRPVSLGIGMAGARTEGDRDRIRTAAAKVWPGVPCWATNDLEIALVAGARSTVRGRRPEVRARVLVLSGTGSCSFGRTSAGGEIRVGGWGHLLDDKGSGYDIALSALQEVISDYDRSGNWSGLGAGILRALQLNEPEDLIDWVQNASKKDVAALTVEVFRSQGKGDRIARRVLASAASRLATDAAACARRLVRTHLPVHFVFAGSVILKQPRFAGEIARQLRRCWRNAVITPLEHEGVWGALELAGRLLAESNVHPAAARSPRNAARLEPRAERSGSTATEQREGRMAGSIVSSPTEQRNPRSMKLDTLPVGEALGLMMSEDGKIPAAILREGKKIEACIRLVVQAFRRGGRLFYVGAGTSGRLGVLDASECPPTFQTDPEMVQGIVAGGQRALWDSVEQAEDDPDAGAQAMCFRNVGRRDVVIGIAASGRTPFVWGALGQAKARGAVTVLICFNPSLQIGPKDRPRLVIAPNVGPEVLTGSTRLKAGTATKLILNAITTLAMVRLGKVVSNLMVDVHASNAKLRDRATRIVQELTGADYERAWGALEKARWRVREAVEEVGGTLGVERGAWRSATRATVG